VQGADVTRARLIWERLYGDFLMPSRLEEYRALLERSLGAGYRIVSVEGFWGLLGGAGLEPGARYLVLRHDIDTGPRTAAAMWQIERELGIAGSFYFRLSTLEPELMGSIAAAGGEASYHYEELASLAKRRHLRSRAAILAHLPEARELFGRNLARLRTLTGLPMRVVAAHGDFVNRRHGIRNWVLLEDRALREELGIELEAYDEAFMRHVSSRHADLIDRRRWTPEDPLAAIGRAEPLVYVLVHPRGWQVERLANARDDALRAWEALLYALPVGSGDPARSA
jgi:hypothetical protein